MGNNTSEKIGKSIDLNHPTILGTGESYHGEVLLEGAELAISYCGASLLHYPSQDEITFIDKCIFYAAKIKLLAMDCSQYSPLQLDGCSSYVLGGEHYFHPDGWSEIEILTQSAKLFLPSSAKILTYHIDQAHEGYRSCLPKEAEIELFLGNHELINEILAIARIPGNLQT